MATWDEFGQQAPGLAASGRALLYQHGVGLGFLATVRADGGPRLHPICPFVLDGLLLTFVVPSPKLADLRRDGRFALHTFGSEGSDDEFYVTGAAIEVGDEATRSAAAAAYHIDVADDHVLFELNLHRALHAAYRERGAWPPTYTRWRSG